ncbi:MAG: extracellular solute-binding protein [Candidatus Korarchaeota archaeon]
MKKLALFVFFLVSLAFISGISQVGVKPRQKTTLLFWYTESDEEELFLKDIIDEYESSHPEVDVVLQRQDFFTSRDVYRNAFQAGNPPAIFRSSEGDLAEWIYKGMCAELTDYFKDDIDDLIPEVKYTAMYAGRLYAMPQTVDLLVLFYNKKMFTSANLALPPNVLTNDTWSWSQFISAAIALKNYTSSGYSFNIYKELQYSFNIFLWDFGGDFWESEVREDGFVIYKCDPYHITINSTQAADALRFMLSFKNVYGFMALSHTDVATQFKEGQIAMVIEGPWSIKTILQGAAFKGNVSNLGIAPFPENGTVNRRKSPIGGHAYIVPPKEVIGSAKFDAAIELVRYLTSTEMNVRRAVALGLLPVRYSAWNDPNVINDPIMQQLRAYLRFGRMAHPLLVNWKGFSYDDLGNGLKRAWNGEDAQIVLNDVATKWATNEYLTLEFREPKPIVKPDYTYLVAIFLVAIFMLPVASSAFKALKNLSKYEKLILEPATGGEPSSEAVSKEVK